MPKCCCGVAVLVVLGLAGCGQSTPGDASSDDSPAVLLATPQSVTLAEGAQASLAVSLDKAPAAGTVIVEVSSTDRTIVTASPSTLTFTAADFANAQNVQLVAVHDADLASDIAFVHLSSSSAERSSVAVSVTDDDSQVIVVAPTALAVVEPQVPGVERGRVDVRLGFQPPGDVTVGVSSMAPTRLTVSPATLTFNAGNFNAFQAVTVTPIADSDMVDDTVDVTFTASADASAAPVIVPVTIIDNARQRIVVSSKSISAVEGGSTAELNVRLALMPSASTTVRIGNSNNAKVSSSTTSLTFEPTNFATPQSVFVSGIADDDVSDEVASMTVSADSIDDAETVVVTVTDDDNPSVIVESTPTSLIEGGTSTFTVRLGFRPASDVTVNVLSSRPQALSIVPSALTFGSDGLGDWRTPQTVTLVFAADDDVHDDDITVLASANGLPAVASFDVEVLDTDRQALVVASEIIVNAGSSTSLPVALGFAPAQPLTVTATVVGGGVGEATVSGPRTFDLGNYEAPQAFTVTGISDLDNGPGFIELSVLSTQGSAPPEGVATTRVLLMVVPADSQRILVTQEPAPPFVNSVQEGGPSGTFKVALANPPRGGNDDVVQVRVPTGGPLDGHAAIVSAPSLTFTTANYFVPQTVTFRGLLDGDSSIEVGDIELRLPESTTDAPLGTYPDVVRRVSVRTMDRALTLLAASSHADFFGGAESQQRSNIAFGAGRFVQSGHDGAGVYSVMGGDRDLGVFRPSPVVIGSSPSDATQVITFNGSAFAAFAHDGASIRYTKLSSSLSADGSAALASGAREFSVAYDPENARYGVLYRSDSDNLRMAFVPDTGGAVSAPRMVTTADASADRGPSLLYLGNAWTWNGVPTPYVAFYTEAGGGLTCLRLDANGSVRPGGTAQVSSTAALHSVIHTGTMPVGARSDSAGLALEAYALNDNNSVAACEVVGLLILRGADAYLHPPAVAFNGLEYAVAFDVQRGFGAVVGVALYAGGAPSVWLLDGPADVPGERPSITWAGDRWILRYASASGVQVRAGSMVP